MAITVVQSGQTAGGANATSLPISAATAGNLLCSFYSQSGANAPTCSGFTVVATSAVYNTSADTVWFAYKTAAGGETSIAWTIGSGGTAHGVCGWELAGAATPASFDVTAVHTDNVSAATATSPTVTTGTAGSIVLLGLGANAGSGTISAWTGTNVAVNIGTTTARCFGGSFITTSTISSTFTANWATSHVAGLLAVALKPPAAAGGATPTLALLGAGA